MRRRRNLASMQFQNQIVECKMKQDFGRCRKIGLVVRSRGRHRVVGLQVRWHFLNGDEECQFWIKCFQQNLQELFMHHGANAAAVATVVRIVYTATMHTVTTSSNPVQSHG